MLRSTELIGRVIGGRYRLLRPVGSGASAHVYVAEDVRLRRRVAIKVLHPALAEDRAFLRRFQAEAQTVAVLRHRSILRVYDWGEDDGEAYLVMELLEGGSLRSLLDTGARLSLSQAAALGVDVASALAHAHSRGLVHRDIKPANLLFDEDGHVAVADFGIARALAEASWTEPWGAMVGTARYAAPEQLRAVALDGRADVYALAMVLVEAVTGTVPFALDTTLGALIARADRPLPVPAELGPLVPVLEQAGTADPDQRLSAEDMARAIARVATGLRAPAPLTLPGLGHISLDDPPPDRTEMGTGHRSPDGPGLSIMAGDLPPLVVDAPGQSGEQEATAPGPGPLPPLAEEAAAPGPAGAGTTAVAVTAAVVGGTEPVGAPRLPVSPTAAGPPAPRRRRRRWLVGTLVLVAVLVLAGGGAAAYVQLTKPPPTYAVPSLTGKTITAAHVALSPEHLGVAVVDRVWDAAPRGTIITQQPQPGVRLRAKQTVVVTLSKGPQPVLVPSLATLDLAQVKSALSSAGLRIGTVATHTSMSVPDGIVISWSPRGTHLLPGSRVDVVFSAGKPMAVVPAIGPSTATYASMAAAITRAGLVPHEATTYNDAVTSGYVISTYPAGGSSEVVGTGVTVTVSLGPHMVTIPSGIIGESIGQAVQTLEGLGLYSNGVEGNLLAPVTGSDPAVGTSVRYGSSIILVTN